MALHFEYEPLITFMRPRVLRCGENANRCGFGRVLGVPNNQMIRWERSGLSLTTVEEVADRLDVCPSSIWFDYWERVEDYYRARDCRRKALERAREQSRVRESR